MSKFAVFDNTGAPVAFYDEEIHGLREIEGAPNPETLIPSAAVMISEQQWGEFIENVGRRRWHEGDVVVYEPPGPTPEEIAEAARKAAFPNLEPDQFWFVMRASGYEQELRDWVAGLNNPESPAYDPMAWAAASAKLDFDKFFERDSPLVEAAREALGMTEQQFDDLWKYAAFGHEATA